MMNMMGQMWPELDEPDGRWTDERTGQHGIHAPEYDGHDGTAPGNGQHGKHGHGKHGQHGNGKYGQPGNGQHGNGWRQTAAAGSWRSGHSDDPRQAHERRQ